MRVLIAPFTLNNPYQSALIASLVRHGASVETRAINKSLPYSLSRYDVIHLHWLHPYFRGGYLATRLARLGGFVLSLSLARLFGCRVFWTVHNIQPHESDHPRLDAVITRFVIAIANGIIVHCEWARYELQRTYAGIDCSRVSVIPHGNYVDDYGRLPKPDVARKALSLPSGHAVFLFFGFIRPYKGIDELITAIKELSVHRTVSLIVAGKPATPALRERILHQCEGLENIHLLLDYVDTEQVPGLFSAADFHVLPYRDIVTSGAAILGMTMGKALIAPRLGCMPETLDEQGSILFDPEDERGLYGAMSSAVSMQGEAVAMGRHNRELAEGLDWDDIAQQTLSLFNASKKTIGD